ncbi:hypothetical protein RhiJN_05855 [Ceratobasidium sp. AG-Ba]|nr:hypothetical protein RhiJN_05855 [Ceratobasidium sp. AG-Ba]QRW06784.1 hypothetical protein RhiLY_05783 [Ceratobasidium sp. AG-Ba]
MFSTLIFTTTAPASSEHAATVTEDESEPEAVKPTTRKRVRKERKSSNQPSEPPVKRVRGKKGKLQGLMNMPIDVFTEISKYLYPIDLILLARANKFFRNLLMNRSAIQTWRYALSNVPDLPPCPKNMCEPQYAALMFSKHCSLCGKQALRPMDPELQVRLCPACRDSQLTVAGDRNERLVNSSSSIKPRKNGRRGWWCLRRDLAAVLAKIEELDRIGDVAAKSLWIKEREREVAERTQEAKPLAEFLREMEDQQRDDLAMRKSNREAEIRSRLFKLGWTREDFHMRELPAVMKWNSLVCIAKPLTERNWETILPQLTKLLEQNRELRLRLEAAARRQDRYSKVRHWIMSYLKKLPPYAWTIEPTPTALEEGVDSVATCSNSDHRIAPASDDEHRTLKWPTPSSGLAMSWTPFKLLLETDRLSEEFEAILEEQGPTFMDLLIEWRTQSERALASRLPTDTLTCRESHAGKVLGESSDPLSNAISKLDILVDSRPIRDVSLDVQRLLRADAVFSRYTSFEYYPEDMQDSYSSEANAWRYDEEKSNIAKALLTSLGRPDATYLEMKAMGDSFTCGRCCARNCVTWRQLVNHISEEQKMAERAQKHPLVVNGTLTYIFTHGTQSTSNEQSLVRIANGEDKQLPYKAGYRGSTFRCSICSSMHFYEAYSRTAVEEHLHRVHLIQNVKAGEHYQ